MSDERDYVKDMSDLQALEKTDGWKLLLSESRRLFDDLTDRILDPKTDPDQVESLRQARGRLNEDLMPKKMLENLISKTRPLAEKQTHKAKMGTL